MELRKELYRIKAVLFFIQKESLPPLLPRVMATSKSETVVEGV
jgi:hypothetical protein